MKRILAKMLGGALTTLVAAFFLAFIAWFTVPRFLGWQPQVVLSGSMEPALRTGGVAFVEPKDPGDVRVGDVLTFRRPDNPSVLVTHRVTEVTQDAGRPSFTTKGDANEYADDWSVPAANVIGTVEYDLPYLGYVTERVHTRLGFLLVIGLPASLIVLGEVRNIVLEIRKHRARKEAAS